ncbi:hypothetical protein TNCT_188021 [Trichonephila clavata]|uniref:Uncharacterized protein n=1 Tax=Trichonephila clavata TaxID=2740835 RepID=A0A8X6LL73_TRICU|nr:hypothetical protein TNCT_188021 [Trichonephila clavata]
MSPALITDKCPSCNLVFPDFVPYFDHECSTQNEQELTHVNMNDVLMYPNTRYALRTSDESLTGNIPVNEDENKYFLTDMSIDVGSLNFDFPNNSKIQIHVDTPNEGGTLLPDPNTFNNYSDIPNPNNKEYLEHKLNEPSISSGIRHWRQNIAQSNTYFPMVSPQFNANKFSHMEVNPRFNRSQPFVSAKCRKMDCFNREMNALINENVPVFTNAVENKPLIGKVHLNKNKIEPN